MICPHISIARAAYGSTANCVNCKRPVIHDGKKWRDVLDIGIRKSLKMRQAYEFDRLTGKYS